jgi:hypothetical protein
VELIGPYLAACVLLVAAGAAKVLRPGDTARALADTVPLPLRPMRSAVRAGALAEAILGAVALLRPGPATAGLVAASYLAFALYVATVSARGGPLASCGCFGTPDTPAMPIHVVMDLLLAGSAALVAATVGPGTLTGVLAGQPWHGIPLVLLSLLCAWLLVLTLGSLARVEGARRRLGITRGATA